MSKGPNDRSGVFFDGGFNVFGGDDTFWNNITDNGVSAMRFERSATTIFDIQNFGELKLTSVTGATGSALEVNALTAQATSTSQGVGALTIRDKEASDLLLTVNKKVIGSGWATELRVRDTGAPSNDDIGLRIVHDIRSASPPQSAKLLSVGYSNDANAYQEQFYCSQSGDVVLAGTAVDLLWADGGNIGTSSASKPTNIYAGTLVNANGSVLQQNGLSLGPAGATDKTITALQAASSPYIKYVNGSNKWQFSHNGSTPLDFGTSNVASWDDLYALDTNLTISGAALSFTKTSTTGYGFAVTRNTASNNAGLIYFDSQNVSDVYSTLSVLTAGTGYCINTINSNTTHGSDKALATTGYATFNKSIQNSTLSTYYSLVTGNVAGGSSFGVGNTTVNCFRAIYTRGSVADNAAAYIIGFNASGSATSEATQKRAFNADANWNYGLYSSSVGLFEVNKAENALTVCQNNASGNLLNLREGTISSGTNRVTVSKTGEAALDNNSSNSVLTLAQNSDGNLLLLKDGTVSGGTDVFKIDDVGFVTNTPTNPTATYTAHNITVVNGGLSAKWSGFTGLKIDITGHADDDILAADGINVSYTQGSAPAAQIAGVNVGGDWFLGVASGNPISAVWNTADAVPLFQTLGYGLLSSIALTNTTDPGPVTLLFLGDMYDGGTEPDPATPRFTVDQIGRVTINTYSGVTQPALDIIQNATTVGFVKFTGTSGAGTTYSISTDAGATGDMIKVGVNDFVRWIPAYTSPTNGLTWDAIYANDKGLFIDDTELTFAQSSTTGIGFKIKRGYDRDSTDSPIMVVSNEPASGYDDQPALKVATIVNGGAILGPKALDVLIDNKAGITSGEAYGARFVLTTHASDTASAIYYGAYAVGSATGAATKYGFYANKDWTYGFYSKGTVIKSDRQLAVDGDNAYEAYCESNGLTNVNHKVSAIDITVEGNASDTNGNVHGVNVNAFVDNGGSISSKGVYVGKDFSYGLYSESPGYLITALDASAGIPHTLQVKGDTHSQVGGTAFGIDIVHIDLGTGAGAFYGINLDGDAASTTATIGMYIDTNWDYGILSESPSDIKATLDASAGIPHTLKVLGDTSTQVGGTSYGIDIVHTDGGTGAGIFYGINLNGDAASTAATMGMYIDADWDYGFFALSKSLVRVESAANGSNTLAIDTTSAGLTNTLHNIKGIILDVTGNASDTNGIAYGLYVSPFDAAGGTLTSTRALYAGQGWTYSLYALSKARFEPEIVSGGGSGQTWAVEALPVATSTGLPSNDKIAAFKATITDDDNDADPKYYGFYATTTNNGPSTNNKYGFYIDTTWQPRGYSFYSDSGLQHFYSSLGTVTTSVILTDISLSATLNSNGNYAKLLSLSATPGADADGTTWTGIDIQKFSSTEKFPSKAINVAGGAYYWDFGLYIEDTTVYCDYDFGVYSPASNVGPFTVASSNPTSALGSGNRYIGLSVYHTGNASDSGGYIYGAYVTGDGAQGASSYRGYYAGSACDIGFYSDAAVEALYAINGRIRTYVSSGTLPATTVGLNYLQYTSNNISTGNHFGYQSRFVYGTDSGGAWYGFIADTSGTPAASLTTYGFRAQSTLDIGIDSYAAANNFIRSNDISTSASPVVNIDNQDDDSSGGTAAALKVANTYSSLSSRVIEIDNAYSSSTEGTRRAITLTSAKTNRRWALRGMAQPLMPNATTSMYYYGGSTINRSAWITSGATAQYIHIPLLAPHRSQITNIYVHFYTSSDMSLTASERAAAYSYYSSENNTLASLLQGPVYSPTYLTGNHTINLTTDINIDNTLYDYFVILSCNQFTGTLYYMNVYFDYSLSDISAPVGW